MGRFSLAHCTLLSKGTADLADPGVAAQLNRKHPPRAHPLPTTLPPGLPNTRLQVKLRDRYRKLKPLAGTGIAGYRNEYLTALVTTMHCPVANSAVKAHEEFAAHYINAELPA